MDIFPLKESLTGRILDIDGGQFQSPRTLQRMAKGRKKPITSALTIRIFPHSEGGYNYDIYPTEDIEDTSDSIDGGLCTSSLQNALDMAVEQAKALMPDESETCLCARCASGDVRHCPDCGPNEGPEDEAIKKDCPTCEGTGAMSL